MRNRAGTMVSLLIVAIVVFGTILAMIELNPFWVAMGIWATLTAFLPVILTHNIRNILPWWLLALVASPFILSLIGYFFNYHISRLTFAGSWIAEIGCIFMVSLVTMLIIRAYSQVRMNQTFTISSAFLLYMGVLGIYGILDFYGDILFGTDNVPSNADYMIFLTASTIGGVVLSMLFSYYLRTISFEEFQATMVGKGVRI